MEVLEARPPYIRFETRAVEKQKLAVDGGGLYYVDEDFALVTPHGSKDIIEKVWREWLPHLEQQARQGLMNPRWLDAYKAAYQAWKNDQPMPVNGTPIRNWPAASPSEVKNLAQQGILAVEDLAVANEELLSRIGMGARSLKQRAIDWVQANSDKAPLVAKLDAQAGIISGQQQAIDDLRVRLAKAEEALQNKQQANPLPLQPRIDFSAALERSLDSARRQEDAAVDATIGEVLG